MKQIMHLVYDDTFCHTEKPLKVIAHGLICIMLFELKINHGIKFVQAVRCEECRAISSSAGDSSGCQARWPGGPPEPVWGM